MRREERERHAAAYRAGGYAVALLRKHVPFSYLARRSQNPQQWGFVGTDPSAFGETSVSATVLMAGWHAEMWWRSYYDPDRSLSRILEAVRDESLPEDDALDQLRATSSPQDWEQWHAAAKELVADYWAEITRVATALLDAPRLLTQARVRRITGL